MELKELSAKGQEYLDYFSRPQSEIDKTMEEIRAKNKAFQRIKTFNKITNVLKYAGVLLFVTIGLGLGEGGTTMEVIQIALNN